MRYLVVLVVLVVLVCLCQNIGLAQEEEKDGVISQILESAKPTILWDFEDNKLLGGIVASIADYKDLVSLDIGGITDLNSNALLLGLSANIQTWAEKGGLTFNLPEKVSFGGFTARDFSNEDWLFGVNMTYKITW